MSLTIPTVTTLQTELVDELGEDSSDTDVMTRIETWLNDTFEDILLRLSDWKWARSKKAITFSIPYSTGTVQVTNGSASVVGTGTSWDTSWKHRVFWIPGQGVNYRVASVVSPTQLTLESEWSEADATLQSYYLVQEAYPIDNQAYEAGITEVVNPYAEDTLEELDISVFLSRIPRLRNFGDPTAYIIWGQEDTDASSNENAPVVYFDSYPSSTRTFYYFYHKQFERITGAQKFPLPMKYNRALLKLGVRIRSGRFDGDVLDEFKQQYEGTIGIMIQENSKTGNRLRQFKETDLPRANVEARLPSKYPDYDV